MATVLFQKLKKKTLLPGGGVLRTLCQKAPYTTTTTTTTTTTITTNSRGVRCKRKMHNYDDGEEEEDMKPLSHVKIIRRPNPPPTAPNPTTSTIRASIRTVRLTEAEAMAVT